MQGRMLAVAAAANDQAENEEAVGVRSPESVLMMGSPENWDVKRKEQHGCNNLDKKVKFFVRLRSLTRSDPGR